MIFDPVTATPKRWTKNAWHAMAASTQALSARPTGRAVLAASACHIIHAPGSPNHLLKMEQPQLCFQCHSDVKPQFSMPFHHKVEEGLIDCTDCHDAHGASWREYAALLLDGSSSMCTKCHVPVAGPFDYEHAAVKAEGCMACHVPHGGPNPQLLIQAM
jgi:DmsE family decaheme c-type cytochrome